jgi:hypothetical protein
MQILMPQIRVRKQFAGKCRRRTAYKLIANTATAAFVVLCLIAAYLGLTPNVIPEYGQSDKGLHFVTFFLLTVGSFKSYHMLPHFLSLPLQQLASDHMQLSYSINKSTTLSQANKV